MRTKNSSLTRALPAAFALLLLVCGNPDAARADQQEGSPTGSAPALAPPGAEQELALPHAPGTGGAALPAPTPVREETTEVNVLAPAASVLKGEGATDVLVVESNPPGARVFVDGEEKGTTPASVKGLGDGDHEVVLYSTDYGAFRQSLTGKGGHLVVDLRTGAGLGLGFVTIKTVPPDARIEVNGKKAGLSPLELPLEAGAHTVHATKEGFKDADVPVEVARDARKTVEIRLEPKEGALLVLSDPAGADVELDGKTAGKTLEPLTLKDIAPGIHGVRVTKQGFRTWEKADVLVRSERTTTVLCALLPERLESWVRLYTKPVGARVWLDGVDIGVASEDGLAFKTTKGGHSLRLDVNPALNPGFLPLQVSVTFSEDDVDFKATPFALPPIDENYTTALRLLERGQREEALGFLDRVPAGHASYGQARLTVVEVLRALGRTKDIPNELGSLLARAEYQSNPTLQLALGYWSLLAARDATEAEAKGLLAKGLEALERAADGTDRFPPDQRDVLALKTQYFLALTAEILFDLTGEKKHVRKGGQAWDLFFARLDQKPKALEGEWVEKARRHRQNLEYLAKKLG